MTFPLVPIGKYCLPTGQWDPAVDPGTEFTYIDISSVDREQKRIVSTQKIKGAEAPSRARKVVSSGDVLVSTVRPNLNAVAKVPPDLDGEIASTGFCVLRADDEHLDGDYLYYWVRSPDFVAHLVSRMRGANYPAVSDRVVKNTEIPLPGLPEQRRIVAILDRADALRRKRAEADQLAARILPALFHEMFGDEENRFPKKKLERLLRDRNGALQSGPFGSNLHNSDFVPEGTVLAVGIDNVHDSGFELGRERRITEEKYSELAKYTLEPGDVLITIMGTVGRTCVFPDWAELAICTKHVYRIQMREDEINPDYLCACFRFSPSARNQLGASTTGQIVEGITSKALRNLELKVPPIGLQREFSVRKAEMDAHFRLTDLAAENLNQLSQVFTHQAFAGEWRS